MYGKDGGDGKDNAELVTFSIKVVLNILNEGRLLTWNVHLFLVRVNVFKHNLISKFDISKLVENSQFSGRDYDLNVDMNSSYKSENRNSMSVLLTTNDVTASFARHHLDSLQLSDDTQLNISSLLYHQPPTCWTAIAVDAPNTWSWMLFYSSGDEYSNRTLLSDYFNLNLKCRTFFI